VSLNAAPYNVINSNSIGVFENRSDLFWKSQDCYYNYKSNLAGTGSIFYVFVVLWHPLMQK